MKSATQRKYSGRARMAYEQQRQDRLWMEDRIEEYFNHSDTDGPVHIAPVRPLTESLMDAPRLDADDSGCDWSSLSDEPGTASSAAACAASCVREDAPDVRCTADRSASRVAVPVIRPPRVHPLLPNSAGASFSPVFRWSQFAFGCILGTAAGLAILWLVLALLD